MKKENILFIALIVLTLLNVLLTVELVKTQDTITDLGKKILNVNNRLYLVEGHIPSLDLNDERFYKNIEDLNRNDQLLKQHIEWLDSILITLGE